MEQVKNLDDKRVCDQSKDGKVIVIRKMNWLISSWTSSSYPQIW